MDSTPIIENAAAAGIAFNGGLPLGDWDLVSALTNAQNYGKLIGGGILGLIAVILLIGAAIFVLQKFFSKNNDSKSWGIIIAMIIVGGAFGTGGWVLLSQVASGGQKTVQELGGGFIVFQSLLWMAH